MTTQPEPLKPWHAEVLAMNVTQLRQVVAHRPPVSYGDCFRTCIACLIGADDPTEVPHFVADTIARYGDDGPDGERPAWCDLKAARNWLRRTYDLDLFPMTPPDADEMGVHYKATVLSPLGVTHSVIARCGRVVWCPAGHDTTAMEMLPDQSAWVIARPWLPGPAGMVAEWRRKVETDRG